MSNGPYGRPLRHSIDLEKTLYRLVAMLDDDPWIGHRIRQVAFQIRKEMQAATDVDLDKKYLKK